MNPPHRRSPPSRLPLLSYTHIRKALPASHACCYFLFSTVYPSVFILRRRISILSPYDYYWLKLLYYRAPACSSSRN